MARPPKYTRIHAPQIRVPIVLSAQKCVTAPLLSLGDTKTHETDQLRPKMRQLPSSSLFPEGILMKRGGGQKRRDALFIVRALNDGMFSSSSRTFYSFFPGEKIKDGEMEKNVIRQRHHLPICVVAMMTITHGELLLFHHVLCAVFFLHVCQGDTFTTRQISEKCLPPRPGQLQWSSTVSAPN